MAEVIRKEFRPSPCDDSPVITNSTIPTTLPTSISIKDIEGMNSILSASPNPSSTVRFMSFGNEEAMEHQMNDFEILDSYQNTPKSYNEPSSFNDSVSGNKPPSSSYSKDHVLAERKRREKLSRLFASLSTTIPWHQKVPHR